MTKNFNNEEPENNEVNDRLIELTDEETGEKVVFEHLDTIEMNDKTYFVVTEFYEEEQEENDVYVMTVVTLENGEESLEIVDNEDEVTAVYEEFKTRCDGEFDFLDD